MSDDRQLLTEWAESFCETEHDGETSFGERVMLAKAALRVLELLAKAETRLAEAEGVILALRENGAPPKVVAKTAMWLGTPGGRIYLPEDATITIEYPKDDAP